MKRDLVSTYSYHLFRIVQTTWSLCLLALVVPMIVVNARGSTWGAIYVGAIILYAIASCGIFFRNRWSWIVSIAFLAGYWLLQGWLGWIRFSIDVRAFYGGHEHYQDFPLAIVIVMITAILGIFPATSLLILGALARRRIVPILKEAFTPDSGCGCGTTEEYPVTR